MSGIFGIFRFDDEKLSSNDLERMSNALRHRGPDRLKFRIDGRVGLGHCLMRVNREDFYDAQPLRDEKAGLLLVADCRIDNREELAEILAISEEDLAVLPDSALVMRAYRKWGRACSEHLLGEFAFALWDAARGELLLSRDPMGERYFYYHLAEDFFVFATEIKALWAVPNVPCILSEKQIGRDLMFQFPAGDGESFFEGVSIPPGGHMIIVRDGAVETKRYWEPHADPIHSNRDEAYYVATYRRLLAEAVDCRISRTIAPPVLFFSAGFDSAAIAGLAQPRLAAQGRKLIAFSSVLPKAYSGPDRCVRRWVEVCLRDMPHLDVRYFVQTDECVFTNLEKTCKAADAPPLGAHYIYDALYSRAARAGARLAMDGIGGDGTINPRLGNVLAHFLRTGRFRLFFSEFAAQLRVGDFSLRSIVIATARQLLPDWINRLREAFRAPGAGRLISPQFAADLARAGALDLGDTNLGPAPNRAPRERMLRYLRNWIMKNRRNNANEAAAHGLELTRPFRDRRIVEFALAIPEELYIKSGRHRYLALKALADVYPPEFQTREALQDTIEPDRQRGLMTILPEVRSEFERLGADPVLRKYIDFEAVARKLDGLDPQSPDAILVKRALHLARFVQWARPDNR